MLATVMDQWVIRSVGTLVLATIHLRSYISKKHGQKGIVRSGIVLTLKLPLRCYRRAKMFTLTDTESPACHGTSFVSLAAARDYAMSLREFGLCMSFSVGCYKDGKLYLEKIINNNLNMILF